MVARSVPKTPQGTGGCAKQEAGKLKFLTLSFKLAAAWFVVVRLVVRFVVRLGTVFFTEPEGSNAFNSDWGLFEFNNLIISKHIISDACLEKIRPIYTSICNIMQHFAGPGQIGKTYGITPAEFGRIIHYINLMNYKENLHIWLKLNRICLFEIKCLNFLFKKYIFLINIKVIM